MGDEQKNDGVCDNCGKNFPADQLITGPDPYLEEVSDRIVIVTHCQECHQDALDQI